MNWRGLLLDDSLLGSLKSAISFDRLKTGTFHSPKQNGMLSRVQFSWWLCVGHLRMHRFPEFPVCQPAYSRHPPCLTAGDWRLLETNQEPHHEKAKP
jgi:hypothetical protein